MTPQQATALATRLAEAIVDIFPIEYDVEMWPDKEGLAKSLLPLLQAQAVEDSADDVFLHALRVANETLAGDAARLQGENQDLRALVGRMKTIILEHGSWDDGCFYYNGKSASEFEQALADAEKIAP